MVTNNHTLNGSMIHPASWGGSAAWEHWLRQDLSPLAYFLGAFLGDGYAPYTPATYRYYVRIACAEEEIIKRCYGEVGTYFPAMRVARRGTRIVNQKTLIHIVQWNNIPLTEFVLCITNGKRQIPVFLWDASHQTRLDFLAGLMDTDGYIHVGRVPESGRLKKNYMRFCGAHSFVEQFGTLCASLGIHTRFSYSNGGPFATKQQLHFSFSLAVAIQAGFRFHCQRKQALLDEYRLHPRSRLRPYRHRRRENAQDTV